MSRGGRGRTVSAASITFIARDPVEARRIEAVPRREAFEDEVVGDKLVRAVVVRAARGRETLIEVGAEGRLSSAAHFIGPMSSPFRKKLFCVCTETTSVLSVLAAAIAAAIARSISFQRRGAESRLSVPQPCSNRFAVSYLQT